MNTAVKKVETNLPATGVTKNKYAGRGVEKAQADDYLIPFVQIAQALSPQMDKSHAQYVKGLEQGQYFNTATGEILGESIIAIPVSYERKFLEFNLREAGGGLVNIHDDYDLDTCTKDDRKRDITDNGTQIVDTRSFYCLVKNAKGVFKPAVLSFKSTQAKKAKRWLSQASEFEWTRDGETFMAPLFSHSYTLTSIQEKNAQGSWYGHVITPLDEFEEGDETFQEADAFWENLSGGKAAADYAKMDGAVEPEPSEVPMQ